MSKRSGVLDSFEIARLYPAVMACLIVEVEMGNCRSLASEATLREMDSPTTTPMMHPTITPATPQRSSHPAREGRCGLLVVAGPVGGTGGGTGTPLPLSCVIELLLSLMDYRGRYTCPLFAEQRTRLGHRCPFPHAAVASHTSADIILFRPAESRGRRSGIGGSPVHGNLHDPPEIPPEPPDIMAGRP